LAHQAGPGFVPQVAVFQAPDYAKLVPFPEFNLLFMAPANYRFIAFKGPLAAGFPVTEYPLDVVAAFQGLQNIDHLAAYDR
jgi:hypothetical protein